MDKKVLVLSDSIWAMFLFGLGNLRASTIEKALNSEKYKDYQVVSSEWKVNRFLLLFARQSIYIFLQKK